MSYIRHVRLTAKGSSGGIVINPDGKEPAQIKIAFSIDKGISSSQNASTITIYNLEEGHRKSMGKELDDITLEAGYIDEQNVGIIFAGQVRDVAHSIEDGVNIATTLTCGDGDQAIRAATVSKTYPAGTKVEEVVKDIKAEFEKQGIKEGEIKLPAELKPFERPYTVCGSCKRELDTLGRGKDFYWSIQNGALEIIPADGYIGNVTVLSPETGLVDVPTLTDNGVKAKALLNPDIRPNRRVKIISRIMEMNAKDGEYRVSGCTFSGDNWDGNFLVELVGEALTADDKVDQGVKPEEKEPKTGGATKQEAGLVGPGGGEAPT
jgi:hypothetical protein